MKTTKEKDDCEISQNPELRGVNDQLTTQPEAVKQFREAETVKKELQQEENIKVETT